MKPREREIELLKALSSRQIPSGVFQISRTWKYFLSQLGWPLTGTRVNDQAKRYRRKEKRAGEFKHNAGKGPASVAFPAYAL